MLDLSFISRFHFNFFYIYCVLISSTVSVQHKTIVAFTILVISFPVHHAQGICVIAFVCSNYDFKNTPIDGHTQSSTIIQKGEVKVGVFGVGVEMKGLVPDIKYGESVYNDPIDIANDRAAELKRQGCDLVICLSHLGYEYKSDKVSDKVLAQKTKNIHLIIGGHTHTFLEKPTEEKNLIGETVLINQVGWAGINVGRIDFEFDQKIFAKRDVIIVE